MESKARIAGTVHHVSFRVDDIGAALDFYAGALGFEMLPRPDIPIAGAWLKAGDTEVHLIETPATEATGTPPSRIVPVANHVAFATDDLDAAEAALKKRGLTVERGPSSIRQIFVRDPTGNMIELIPA